MLAQQEPLAQSVRLVRQARKVFKVLLAQRAQQEPRELTARLELRVQQDHKVFKVMLAQAVPQAPSVPQALRVLQVPLARQVPRAVLVPVPL
jgi:hypothetical protein